MAMRSVLRPVAFLSLIVPFILCNDGKMSPANCGMPGGFCAVNVDDPTVKELASEAVQKIEALSSSPLKLIPVQIVEAQSQVLAGKMYELRLIVGQSTCQKGNTKANCDQEGDQKERKAYIVSAFVPFRGPGKEINFEAETN